MQNKPSPNFLRPRAVTEPTHRLFCFPYAGGSASVYHPWPNSLPAHIDLLAVQYPGRATRLREPACTHLPDLLDDIEAAILPLLDRPYAFFGHSMGATVAFELTRRLRASQRPLPKRLFLSGRSAPQLPPVKAAIHALPQAAFIEAIRTMNGTPSEILEHRELMELMLPTLRADFQVLETWPWQPSDPLPIPFSVFGGMDDPGVPLENLDGWGEWSTSKIKRHIFPGDHFFLHQQHPAMLDLMCRALTSE